MLQILPPYLFPKKISTTDFGHGILSPLCCPATVFDKLSTRPADAGGTRRKTGAAATLEGGMRPLRGVRVRRCRTYF